MTRQIVLNFIANNDVKIALYMSTISVGSDQKCMYLYSRRELLLRNACRLLNGQCENSRVLRRNEFVFVK